MCGVFVWSFKVLCGPPACLSWVDASGGDIPNHAVPGGHEVDGETLYIGRVLHNGSVTVGKVHPSHGSCYIPYGKLALLDHIKVIIMQSIFLNGCFTIKLRKVEYFYF